MTHSDVFGHPLERACAIRLEDVAALAVELVRTPSHRHADGREGPLVRLVADRLSRAHLQPVLADVMMGRANLFCTLVGREPGPHLMLCAHSDTRPPDEGERTAVVEEATEGAGNLTGLGAASKGALAAMIVALESLRASNALARGAVTLAVLIDREGEALGAEDLVRSPVRADAALVAEPTENRLCVGHPGVESLEISFAASAASAGLGPDAVMAGVRFVQGLGDTLIPSFSQNAHPRLGRPSLIVRGLHGDRPMVGSSRCVVTIERVLMPDETFATVCDELADVIRRVEALSPGLETRLRRVPGTRATLDHVPLLTDERAPVVRVVTEAIRRVRGDAGKTGVLTSWSDAGMLSFYGGLPVALLGPGEAPNGLLRRDTVSLQALHEAARLYAATAQAFCEGMAPGQASLV